MPLYLWSKTAASNANADPTINFAEGQAPSSLNDSSRAVMKAGADWRDDISGTITTGGTNVAYTVTSNQVFDTLAHMNGAMVAFVPHTTCGATVTLNVDGLGAKPLRTAPSVELPSGMLIQGTPYVATYNNSDAVFYLRGFYSLPYTVPVGGILPYVGTTAPNSNFAMLNGQQISRATYATLFAITSTTFGIGDGSTTFNIPDVMGRAIFGLDAMGGAGTLGRISAAGGNFDATVRGATGGAQNHTLTQAELPAVAPTFTGSSVNVAGGQVWGGSSVPRGTGTSDAANANNFGTGTVTAAGTISNLGSGNAHTILPPAIMLPYILRVI